MSDDRRGQGLGALERMPQGVHETMDLVARLDDCFLSGLAGLNPGQRQTLTSLVSLFDDSELYTPLRDSIDALARNEFRERYFAALAAARSALLGATHDALWQQATMALGLSQGSNTASGGAAQDWEPQQKVWMESARHWLMELALAGFTRLEPNMLHPFMATLEQIQSDPALVRQGALMGGFLNELLAAGARPAAHDIPAQRWADLWSRAMTSTLAPPPPRAHERVRGQLFLLGCELLAHDHFASLVCWGLLERDDGSTDLCRTTFSRYKAPVIVGDEIWLLLAQAHEALEALAQQRALRLFDMTLLETGDLLWDAPAVHEQRFDVMDVASRFAVDAMLDRQLILVIKPPTTQRHPLQLTLPVYVQDYTVKTQDGVMVLSLDGVALPIAWERIHPLLGIEATAVRRSKALLALVRFDAGRWSLQPLALSGAIGKKGRRATVVSGAQAAVLLQKPPKHDAVTVLQERAGRLLRPK